MEFYNRNWRVPSSWNGTEDNNNKVSNYSMSFDGSSEYINLGTDSQIQFNTTFSISCWVKTSNTSQNKFIIHRGVTYSETFQDYRLLITSSGTAQLRVNNNSYSVTSTETNLDDGNWHHIVAICDLENTDGYIYVDNGTPATNTSFPSSLNLNTGYSTYISSPGASFDMIGDISELSIFDYSLSQAQVTELYGSSSNGVGNPMAITNGRKPVAFYPLGDYSAYNGTEYLVANSALSDYVFDFDGSDDHIDCGTDSTLNITGSITISCWIKSSNTDANRKLIIKDNMSSSRSYQINTNHASLGPYTYFWLGGGNIKSVNTGTPNQIVDGNWHHLVAIFKSGEYIRMYIDGVQAGNTNVTETTLDSSTASFIIASNGAGGTTRVDGELSNAAIFNIALPATGTESVESLYNYGTPPDISSYSGLQGFWKLDAGSTFDGSNWTVPDESSNSNDGTSSGMTAANLVQSNLNILSPYSRYALDFDGANDYIDFGSGFTTTDQYTISAWINADDLTSSGYGYLLGNSSGTGFSLDEGGGAAGAGKFYLWTGSGTLDVISSTALIINNWFNVVFVCDKTVGTKGEIKFYLNGSIDKITTLSNQDLNSITLLSYIGYSPSHFLNSQLSNVSIWNAALTAAQVSEIYNEGKPSNLNNHSAYSNLVSWWQLGENSSFNSNWTVIDEKGTNNGTSANMAEDDLVNGVGTTANGLSSGMGGADNINGDAPYSTSNALSYGMGADAKSTSVPT